MFSRFEPSISVVFLVFNSLSLLLGLASATVHLLSSFTWIFFCCCLCLRSPWTPNLPYHPSLCLLEFSICSTVLHIWLHYLNMAAHLWQFVVRIHRWSFKVFWISFSWPSFGWYIMCFEAWGEGWWGVITHTTQIESVVLASWGALGPSLYCRWLVCCCAGGIFFFLVSWSPFYTDWLHRHSPAHCTVFGHVHRFLHSWVPCASFPRDLCQHLWCLLCGFHDCVYSNGGTRPER